MSKLTDAIKAYNKDTKSMVTPRAVAVFPWLSRAKTKVGDKVVDPNYCTDIRLDPNVEAHAAFIEKVERIVDEAKALIPKKAIAEKGWRSPLKDELDKDSEEPTGFVLFSAKTHALDKEGNKKQLTIVDASKKNKVTVPVFGGSEVKLIVKANLYSGGIGSGISIYLNAVQVLSLVTSGGADTSLFDEEEGFFSEAAFANESDDAPRPQDVADGDDSDY